MKFTKTIFYYLFLVTLVACSNAESNSQTVSQQNSLDLSGQKILIILNNGGCIRMGPNCPRYELMRDGSFTVHRGDDTEISESGNIEGALVNRWVDLVNKTNFAELRSRLGKGECKACYDGVDFTYTIFKSDAPIVFNSQENDFSESEAFFILSEKIHAAMNMASSLEIKSHR